ncbi:hypothetical protein ACXR8U_33060 (plasmid) [Methylobacterium radiotolerans]|jgi:hypothetical protein
MPRPASTAASTRLALLTHIEELRAELASVSCPTERRQIERDLHAVRAQLGTLQTGG